MTVILTKLHKKPQLSSDTSLLHGQVGSPNTQKNKHKVTSTRPPPITSKGRLEHSSYNPQPRKKMKNTKH